MGLQCEAGVESEPFLGYSESVPAGHWKVKRKLTRQVLHWTWILITLFLAFATFELLVLNKQLAAASDQCVSQHAGLSSELESARGTIGYRDIIFTSGIEENDHGQMFLNLPPGPRYVGNPSKEIDDAWADLTKATEIWVTGDEAKSVANRTIGSEDGWLVSLDVYHSLHCVNLARKGLDWDYYYGDQPGQQPIDYITKDHIYHCLEHLRQVAMCHGDLTPMRFQFTEKSAMPIWEEPHTCRDWDSIKKWAEARRRRLDKPFPHPGHGHRVR